MTACSIASPLVAGRDHRIQRAVDRFDAVDATVQQFNRRDILAADATAQFDGT
jgi:hypothetical protein